MKKRPIRAKIVRLVLVVSIFALIVGTTATFWGMSNTRGTALRSSQELGQVAAADSESALVEQAKANLLREVRAKAELTEERLTHIRKQVDMLADYIEPILSSAAMVTDARQEDGSGWVMQYARVNGVPDAVLEAERARAAQAQFILGPVCRESEDIHSVYFASERGVMASYDNRPDDAYEQLFLDGYDPRNRDWYKTAAATGRAAFTSTYLDAFGRLMTTCAAPLHSPEGKLDGVLGMDLLIQDINQSVVSAKVGNGGYAFLMDKKGVLI